MRITRFLVPVAALCAMTAGATTANALPEPAPAPEVGFLTPEAEAQFQHEFSHSTPVVATYQGREINLAEDWQGAQACTEVPNGRVHCYATAEEANRAAARVAPTSMTQVKNHSVSLTARGALGSAASDDCRSPFVPLWEHSNFTGRRLQWSSAGTKQLGDWGFRDKASSGCVNRIQGGASVYDARTALPDPYMSLANLYCYDFTRANYPTGGNWNDKADYIKL